uniref:Uncharacterized protein n=1 Tax=Florenciella parvula TaxID=236787 RepID=A0A7S2CV94_9STRA|mmetsp:Transcript_5756/g.11723  ORF Transcript_5756/g.11723 Transcript_5756/m.11723 type:complete len:445 (+) Transcript_5756:225-1559(+)
MVDRRRNHGEQKLRRSILLPSFRASNFILMMTLFASVCMKQMGAPSRMILSVNVTLDGMQTPTPLELFEGQDTQSAAITFCQTHNIAQSPPLVQQLAQLLQTRLRESKTVEPALSMGIAVGDSEAILEHYDGQDPTVEVRDFCLRHGYADDNEVARAELATCTTALGEALQARLTDLAHQRIQESLAPTPDSIGAANDAQGELRTSVVMRVPVEIGDARVGMLELFENESPADAARRFLERESLEPDPAFIETLETALKERLASAAETVNIGGAEGGGMGPAGVLFKVPLNINGIEVEMEVMKGQAPLVAAEAFCRRSEYGFKGAGLMSCVEQTEKLARERIEATVPSAEKNSVGAMGATEVEEEPLFNIPINIGDKEAIIPYYSAFSPNETATAFCEVNWESISAGVTTPVHMHDCTSLISSTIKGVLDRISYLHSPPSGLAP